MHTQQTPLVSIIVPVFNVEKYLNECLNSIVNQSLLNIEIICINDGSTDNSYKILKSYADKEKRIKLYSQENQGVAVARNYALKEAKGKYVAFIDPDDIYPNNDIIKNLYEAAEKSGCMIAGGEIQLLLPNNTIMQPDFNNDYDAEFPNYGIVKYEEYQYDYGFQRYIFNRKMLIDNNIYFPLYRRYQDPPFFIKAMHQAGRFFAINKTTYLYRVDYKQINWSSNKYIKLLDFINGIYEELLFSIDHNYFKLQEVILYRFFNKQKHFKSIILPNCTNEAVNESTTKILNLIEKINHDIVVEETYNTIFYSEKYDATCEQKPIENNSKTKVSIVVPVYNVEKYLRECLDSLINQTLKEIEIICVDDCSTDNSSKIMEEYASRDSRIKNIHLKENGGLSNARNIAIPHITGEYVIFIDSDDMLELNALEELYNLATSNNSDQILFLFNPLNEGDYSDIAKHYNVEHPKPLSNKVFSGHYLFRRLLEEDKFLVSACCKFTRTKLIKDNNITFIPKYIHEDNYFTAKVLVIANRVIAINKKYYILRLRPGSIMTDNNPIKNIRHALGYAVNIGALQTEIDKGLYSINQQNALILFCAQKTTLIADYLSCIPPKKLDEIIALLSKYSNRDDWRYIIHSLNCYKQIQDSMIAEKLAKDIFIVRFLTKLCSAIRCINDFGFIYTFKYCIKLILESRKSKDN